MTTTLTLLRDVFTQNETCGWTSFNGRKWATVERTWVASQLTAAGQKGVSCVPPGEYRLEPHNTEAHPKCWALVNHALDIYHWDWEVPASRRGIARTVCLIHPANWAHELRGCVAPGKRRGLENGRWRTFESRDAMNEIRSVLGSAVDVRFVVSEQR